MLRLVGGTSVTKPNVQATGTATATVGPALKAPNVARKRPYEPILPRPPSPLDDQARKFVLAYETGAGTVGTLINSVNKPDEPVSTFAMAGLLLHKMGILLSSGGASLGMSQDAFATVFDGRALRKRIPELKKLDIQLEGLGLY